MTQKGGYPEGYASLDAHFFDDDNGSLPDDWKTVLKFDVGGVGYGILTIFNTSDNDLKYRIFGSVSPIEVIQDNDPSWVSLKDETILAAHDNTIEGWIMPWQFMMMQMKNATPSQIAKYKYWGRGR